MEALMRPNPYSSSTIDMCGKRDFGILFSDFLRFFEIFLLRRAYRCVSFVYKRQRKSICSHSEIASKWLQIPSVMGLVGYRKRKYDAENPGVTDGGVQEMATGVGDGIPSRRARREEVDSYRAGVPVPCAKV